MNIAVTGVGGGIGQSIMKSLENSGYNVVALDGEYLAAGLYASKTSYIIPYANKDNYIPKLMDICNNENISLLFPGIDAELMPLSLNRHLFEEIGTTVVVSRPEVITISDDKQQTFEQLTKAGINVPATFLAENFKPNKESYPIILKQKVGGARSKNVYLIKDSLEWESTLNKIGENISAFIVMEYIEGDEYTCGTINFNGSCKGVIIMRRILRDGDTFKCFTIKSDLIETEVRRAVEAIKPFGACNVQLRLKDGKPYIFEINARCSGTTAARKFSGFNEPKMIADFLLKGIEPKYSIKEQTILRYWKELIVDNDHISELKQHQIIKNPKNNFNL
ncbi:ATP-grasp domain-containing protein [Candidatus Neomarinimicrobiota bacterium]